MVAGSGGWGQGMVGWLRPPPMIDEAFGDSPGREHPMKHPATGTVDAAGVATMEVEALLVRAARQAAVLDRA